MEQNKSKRTFRSQRRTSQKEGVWRYMRRNRTFRVGDLLIVSSLAVDTLKPLLWHLHKSGYLELRNNEGKYTDRVYTLIKNTGIRSPAVINGVLYDYNTGEEFKIEIRPTEKIFLDAVWRHRPVCLRKQVLETSGLPEGTLNTYWPRFLRAGYVTATKKGPDGFMRFVVDEALVAHRLQELERMAS